MNVPTFLFFGYGAEYSLRPLFQFMSEQGDQCFEIDMLTETDTIGRLKALVGRPLVFVTSAHLLYDSNNFFYYQTERKIISALHVISTLTPIVSVYYPHDYKDPVKAEEVSYLGLFDLLLWPFPVLNKGYGDIVKSVPVGWIKNTLHPDAIDVVNPARCVFFLGAFQHYLNLGCERFYQDFRDLFDAGVAVKLPYWQDNEAFESFLRSRGVTVYPSTANSIAVMRANDVIITHALSSVCLEACHLGKSVVYIIDSKLDYLDPIEQFRGLGAVAFVNSPLDAVSVKGYELPRNAETMQPFNFPAAREAIWTEYTGKVGA